MTRAGFSLPRHEAFAIAVGFVVIGLGFVIDVTTGRDLSLSLVYVAGVGFMTWTGSLRVGVLGAIGGGAAVVMDGLSNSVVTGTALAKRGDGLRAAPRRHRRHRPPALHDGAGSEPGALRPVDRALEPPGL